MVMKKKLCVIHVIARSNMNTRIQLTLSEETEDLRHLISMALLKLSQFDNGSETYCIEHIDSMPYLYESNE
jgi:hypothetical protein